MLRRVLAISLLLLTTAPCHAAKIYKYLDENGNLAFSDRPMENAKQLDVKLAEHVEYEERFFIRDEGLETRKRILGINNYYGPVEVEVQVRNVLNMAASLQLPARFVVPPRSEGELFRVWPANPRQNSSYSFRTRYVLGDPKAEHLHEAGYLPPLPVGKPFRVTQAFHGSMSHRGPQNAYAVDIATPVGTPIFAARGGVIMDVSTDFYDNGLSPEYADRANAIRILHDDGTMAVYAHLALEGAYYPIGKRIEAGDQIALSGNTGYSSGPHLHFVIQKNAGLELVSLPFTFRDREGQLFTPEAGTFLTR